MQEVSGSIPLTSTNRQSKAVQQHPKNRRNCRFFIAFCVRPGLIFFYYIQRLIGVTIDVVTAKRKELPQFDANSEKNTERLLEGKVVEVVRWSRPVYFGIASGW